MEFHGKGYSDSPLTSEELSKHRHMSAEISEAWPTISQIVTVASAIKIIYNVLKIGGPVLFFMMVVGAYLKSQGVV